MHLRATGVKRSALGLTTLEMSVAVSVAAILTALAAPNFARMQRASARAAAVGDLMHAIYLARSEAIKRNAVVSICRSIDGQRCANKTATWDTGWMVFVNNDRDSPAEADAGETVIHRNAGWLGGQVTSNRATFSFRPMSQADVNGSILFCDPQGGAEDARVIIISHTGRPRVSDRDAANKPLKCD